MTDSHPSLFRPYLHLHFLVFVWSFTAILGKLISIPSLEIVFYRTLFTCISLFVIIKLKGLSLSIDKKNFATIFGTGSIIALHWVLFFLSARVSNISICLAGMATSSLWTSLIDPIMSRRKIKIYEIVLGIVAIIGISVVFDAVIDQYIGFLIAVLSGFLASVFMIINSRLVKKRDHFVISFYQMLGAFLFVLLFLPIYGFIITDNSIQLSLNLSDTICLLILSLACTVYAYSSSIKLMHKLSAFAMTLTINLEPVYGILLAVIIFKDDERMGTSFYWGTAIILCSVLLYPVLSSYDRRRSLKAF
ncbi:DMT family transporter [Reichenbachiella sp. MALMAid0571]|uniref:DMT family transporter n=1 Tax=Reichenbachiella sp. MALMAid0571 TaxID=3143939 RepID=UPI0032DE5604